MQMYEDLLKKSSSRDSLCPYLLQTNRTRKSVQDLSILFLQK